MQTKDFLNRLGITRPTLSFRSQDGVFWTRQYDGIDDAIRDAIYWNGRGCCV
ncbi:hypothetical protein [Actibacterium atlanticum]|uniref:hypothetical protein n=1 Tax=Actibacterium atlanticum TaxID=1461693 RepID=UPI0012DD8C99|nr:hypothetical protein [Actibacterium atlanticum]